MKKTPKRSKKFVDTTDSDELASLELLRWCQANHARIVWRRRGSHECCLVSAKDVHREAPTLAEAVADVRARLMRRAARGG